MYTRFLVQPDYKLIYKEYTMNNNNLFQHEALIKKHSEWRVLLIRVDHRN
jgi:hypothetical protein